LVVPTTTWPEGHPGVIIESLCAGVPVVATDVGGIRDLVDPEVGHLVSPNDAYLIGAGLSDVLSSIQNYQRLSSNCLARSREFSADKWIDSLVGMIEH
jgi:glycosyltransferase involved in cell wall biosynthesis